MTSLVPMNNSKNVLKTLIWKYSRNACREKQISPISICRVAVLMHFHNQFDF